MSLYPRCALLLEPSVHFLDHLGVFATIFKMPALVTDSSLQKVAKKFYPDLETILISPAQLTCTSLVSFAQTFYIPLYRYSHDFLALAATLFEKKPRFIYVPHGFSHKIRMSDIIDHAHLDDFFIYGHQEKQLFESQNIRPSSTFLGNYRQHFFEKNRSFYAKIVKEDIAKHLRKPIYLYAPTWQDPRVETNFFQTIHILIDHLPKDVSLVVKPHPLLYRYELAKMLFLEQELQSKKNVLLLQDYPLIFPLLNEVDALITDHSSIAYDFISFNKPLYLLTNLREEHPLQHCASVVYPHELSKIFSKQTTNPFFEHAMQQYKHTFHSWKNLEEFQTQMEVEHFV